MPMTRQLSVPTVGYLLPADATSASSHQMPQVLNPFTFILGLKLVNKASRAEEKTIKETLAIASYVQVAGLANFTTPHEAPVSYSRMNYEPTRSESTEVDAARIPSIEIQLPAVDQQTNSQADLPTCKVDIQTPEGALTSLSSDQEAIEHSQAELSTCKIDIGIPGAQAVSQPSDQEAIDHSQAKLSAETKGYLRRAVASSPKRKEVAQSCAGEEDNSLGDEDYRPSPRKKARPNGASAPGKKSKDANQVSGNTKKASRRKRSSETPEFQSADATNGASEKSIADTVKAGSRRCAASAEKKSRKARKVSNACHQDDTAFAEMSSQVEASGKAMLSKVRDDVQPDSTEEALPAEFCAAIAAINDCATTQILSLHSKLKASVQAVADLKRDNGLLRGQITKQKAQIASLRRRRPNPSEEMERLMGEMIDLKTPEGYSKLRQNDEVFVDGWNALSLHVRSVAVKAVEGMQQSPAAGWPESKFPFIIGQAVEASRVDPGRCRALIQNWTWRYLVQYVLESNQGPWPALISEAFVAYYRKLLQLMREGDVSPEVVSQIKSTHCCAMHAVHVKQSRTPSGLTEHVESSAKEISAVVLEDMTRSLCGLWNETQGEYAQMKDLLSRILAKASPLARFMLSSQAIFCVGSLDECPFSCDAGDESFIRAPHIVTTPSLKKQGTADGEVLKVCTFLHEGDIWEVPDLRE